MNKMNSPVAKTLCILILCCFNWTALQAGMVDVFIATGQSNAY